MGDTTVIIGIIVGVITILGAVGKLIAKLNRQWRAFEETRTLARRNDETARLLLKASLAILDGLKQQGCNGKVSEMHARLLNYAVDK